MPYWELFYHFVWTTKYRAPTLEEAWETELHKVVVARCKKLESWVYAISGVQDHVHLAVAIPPKHAPSTVIAQIKGNSTHFINHVIQPPHQFAWQTEYGVRSFSKSQLPWIVAYIRNQKEHHALGTLHSDLEPKEGDTFE